MEENPDVMYENCSSKIHGYSRKKLVNENTPKSKTQGHYFDMNKPACRTSDMEQMPPSYESNNQLHMSVSFTPKTPTCNSTREHLDSTKNEFSITNPFESNYTVDSLLQPSFSPSVFRTNSSSNNETDKQCSSGFWNIDQIAILKPTDIDLSLLHQQQDLVRLDPDTEKKAQMAIDEFFASHIEMPSPWSGERSHYLALISPSPAHMKKKANLRTPGAAGSSSSATSSFSSTSQIRVRKLDARKCNRMPTHSEIEVAQNSESKPNALKTSTSTLNTVQCSTVSTQTALTLPPSFDLQSLLAQYFTYNEGGNTKKTELQSDALSTSSLRRKLFFLDGEDVKSLPEDHEHDPSPLIHDDDDEDCKTEGNDEPPVFGNSSSISNNQTPSSHRNKCRNIPQTPSTCQSHFSSSPLCEALKFDVRTPCSGYSQKCGSGIRRRKMILGSSSSGEEDLVTHDFNGIPSPQLSPVQTDIIEEKSDNMMRDVAEESLVEDESMSFCVSSCSTKTTGIQSEAVPEVIVTDLPVTQDESNTPPALESSRKQLLMDSPPLSPIEPIKHKSHDKQSSSMNRINSSGNINTALHPPFSLCPSPMLSPIPCKSKAKKTIQKHHLPMVVDSPLSSTTSSIHPQSNRNPNTDEEDPQINNSEEDEVNCDFFSRVQKLESFSRNSDDTPFDKNKLKARKLKQHVFNLKEKKRNYKQSHNLKPENVMEKHETENMISMLHHQKNLGEINSSPNCLPMQMQGIESDYTCLPPKHDLTSVCYVKRNDDRDFKERNASIHSQNKDYIDVKNNIPICNPTVTANMRFGKSEKASAMETSHRNYRDQTTVCIKNQNHNLQGQNPCEKEAPVSCMMDISLQHLAPDDYSECDNSAHSMNRNNPEGQGDSGYTTVQSNFQTSRISAQAEY